MRLAITFLVMSFAFAACEYVRFASREAVLTTPVDVARIERVLKDARPDAQIMTRTPGDEVWVWVVAGEATVQLHVEGSQVAMWTDFGGADPAPELFECAMRLQSELASALDAAGITRDLATASVAKTNFGL